MSNVLNQIRKDFGRMLQVLIIANSFLNLN